MLIGNVSVLNKSAGRWIGGGATGQGMTLVDFARPGGIRARYLGNPGFDKKTSAPSGYAPGMAFANAQKSGGMATSTGITGAGALVGSGALGMNISSALDGLGDIVSAALALVLSAVATLAGTSTTTGDINGRLDAAAALAGSGDLVGAINALAAIATSIGGTGDVAAALAAKGSLSAEINVTGDLLTTANVAAAVWQAIAEGTITYDQMLRIIAAASAGKVSGGPGSPVFRNLADTKNQVTGTADSNGNRTAATYGD